MKSHHIAIAIAATASSLSTTSINAFTPGPLISTNHRRNRFTPVFADESSTSSTSSTPAAAKPIEQGTHDELMYALGVNLARQLGDVRPLVENSEELTQVARGLLDTVVGKFDDEDQRELLGRRGDDLNKIIIDRANNIRKKIEDAGKAMLKEMSENPETATLESGVVIHPLEAGPDGFGKGVKPTQASTVKCHYHGTLPDGTVFDSSLGGDPVTFPLGGVIKGWQAGLQHMCEGETAMLGIPADMAYGDAGTPDGRIPGGAALFFKIQLIEVLSAGIGGGPKLVGADGRELKKNSGSVLLGADGKPM
jgi:FKBP-type peptidyl-prolyl cis-trans isomerase FklB